jgi:hypothetical protein
MLNLILELFFHNPKLCINYKHWIHHCNKTMNFLYISTNKTCVLNLIWGGGGPQLVGRFFIIHTLAMESPSFSFPLIHEKEKKNRNLLRYMCVCEYINSL